MATWRNYVLGEENNIFKSHLDTCNYRVLHLTNGMNICLVSNPYQIFAAAALDVHVGSMSDPDDIPGLAHFCEHLLFMGTEKYPVENDFRTFVQKHGGYCNACTARQNTKYLFQINSSYLHEALDRFAQFFISPLFTESAIEREVYAVDCEYAGYATDDKCCMLGVDLETMNPDHPYCRFNVGNRGTLHDIPIARGLNIRDELLKFYNKYYSSNIMSLAVYSSHSLDELAEMVVPLFVQVSNKNIAVPMVLTENPIRDEDTQIQINIFPKSDTRMLILT